MPNEQATPRPWQVYNALVAVAEAARDVATCEEGDEPCQGCRKHLRDALTALDKAKGE